VAENAVESGLIIIDEVQDDLAIVHVAGPLTFPDAVTLTGVVKSVLNRPPAVLLLDLTEIEEIDATGVAVLVGVGGDLKDARKEVRVIVSDPRVRHRLPYTLGLRKVFTSQDEAIRFTHGSRAAGSESRRTVVPAWSAPTGANG